MSHSYSTWETTIEPSGREQHHHIPKQPTWQKILILACQLGLALMIVGSFVGFVVAFYFIGYYATKSYTNDPVSIQTGGGLAAGFGGVGLWCVSYFAILLTLWKCCDRKEERESPKIEMV
jgi:hypothetical protein